MAESTAGGSMADRARVRVGTRTRRSLAKLVVGVAFWAWVVLRWLNDWAGGVVVPRQQPFVPPSLFTGLANGVPDVVPFVADALGAVAFAVEFLPTLVDAFWLTIVLTGVATVLGFCIAVPLAGARVYGRLSAWLALGYVELFRGTPLLAQLFVLYYGLPWLPAFFRELPWVGAGFLPDRPSSSPSSGSPSTARPTRRSTSAAPSRASTPDSSWPPARSASPGSRDPVRRLPAGAPVRDSRLDERTGLPHQVLLAGGVHHGPRTVPGGPGHRLDQLPLHGAVRPLRPAVPRPRRHGHHPHGVRRERRLGARRQRDGEPL